LKHEKVAQLTSWNTPVHLSPYNTRYIPPVGKLDRVDPSRIVRRNSRYLK